MPWLEECGHWAVYPAFVSMKTDANRWGICLKQTELGHISFVMMMQGSDKCWECATRKFLEGSQPVASTNPPCGAYQDFGLDARGRPIGTCEPMSRRNVKESDMVLGEGVCLGCSKRNVESDESLTTFRRRSPRQQRGATPMQGLSEAFRRRLEEIGETKILHAVNDRGFPGSYVGDNTVNQYFASHCDEILAEEARAVEFAKSLGFEAQDLKNYLKGLAEQAKAARIAAENGKFDPLKLFQNLCLDPRELELGEGTSVWAVTARIVRAAIAGECPLEELTAVAEKLEIPRTVVLECGLSYLERWGEFIERPPLNLSAELAEALEAFQAEERCTFLRKRTSLVKLLPEELLEEAITEFLASLVRSHDAIVELNQTEGNELGEEASVRTNLANLKYYELDPQKIISAITAATGTSPHQAALIFDEIEAEEPTDPERSDDDDGQIVFLVTGVSHEERGSWKLLAGHVIRDRNPETQPIKGETCEGYLVRMHSLGWPDAAVGILLGGKNAGAISMKLSTLRTTREVSDPTSDQKRELSYLVQLAKDIGDGIITRAASGPNKDLDLATLEAVGDDTAIKPPDDQGLAGGAGSGATGSGSEPQLQTDGRIVFIFKGVGFEGWGSWNKPADGIVLDRNPDFAVQEGESRSDYAARLNGLGFEAPAIGWVLGVEGGSVSRQLTERRSEKKETPSPSQEDRRKYRYLRQLVTELESGKLTTPPPGSPNDVELPPPPAPDPIPLLEVVGTLGPAAENDELMTLASEAAWPTPTDGMTLVDYIRVLKGARVDAETLLDAVYRVYTLDRFGQRSELDAWYNCLEQIEPPGPDPGDPPSPPPPPAPTPPTREHHPDRGPMPPITSAVKAAVSGMNRLKPEVLQEVLWDYAGLTVLELLDLVNMKEIELLQASQQGASE